MNPTIRTAVLGLAVLGMAVTGAVLGLLVWLMITPDWRQAAREKLLTKEEKSLLAADHSKPAEPPPIRVNRPVDVQEAMESIAEEVAKGQVQHLFQDLKRKSRLVDDQRARLEQEWSELRLAQSDLVRLQARLSEQERAIASARNAEDSERARFARVRAEESRHMQVIDEIEKANLRNLAATYEKMSAEESWAALRRLPVDEEARIIALMEPKKAARVLAQAVADQDLPTRSGELHRALLALDLEARSGSQIARLAGLYAFLRPDEILPLLDGVPATEVAAILQAMDGRQKLVGEILTQLRTRNDPREVDIQRLLLDAAKQTQAR
jgi:flagellar motility protein MotE (MotC chaperone)